jgi:RND family efflux transporter MFP subunit
MMAAVWRLLRLLLTWAVVGVAVVLGLHFWQVYTTAPWTRDGRVRAYVVTIAPQVSGEVTRLPVVDNQYVHKGDVLFEIDPADYQLALAAAREGLRSAQTNEAFKAQEAARRARLSNLSVSAEQQQQFATDAAVAAAATAQAVTQLNQAELNLARTQVRSPVDGWVTNLVLQRGDYAQTGVRALSLVDANSFWIDAYFEETTITRLTEGDPASIWLMGDPRALRGHVASVARGIQSDDAASGSSGLASVNPVFTWVRLAQRVPVRVAIDEVPRGVRLVAGTTASVEVKPRP